MDNLQAIFNFDDATLAKNQSGQISDAQRDTLDVYGRNATWGSRAAFFMGIVTFAVVIGGWAISNPLSRDNLQTEALIFSIVGGIILLFILYSRLSSQGILKRIQKAEVLHVQGIAKKSSKKHERIQMTSYYVKIGEVDFQVDSKKNWDTLQDGHHYHFHYIDYPPTNIILSVEALD